jgi:hypothetical protein
MVFVAILVTNAVADLGTRTMARHLQAKGSTVTAVDTQVRVEKSSDRWGTYWDVTDVRAVLPGSQSPVTLELVIVRELPAHSPTGWRSPTAQTGYTGPLGVRTLTDGDGDVLPAATQGDVDSWLTDNLDPEIDGIFAGLALLVALGGVAVFFRGRRRSAVRA